MNDDIIEINDMSKPSSNDPPNDNEELYEIKNIDNFIFDLDVSMKSYLKKYDDNKSLEDVYMWNAHFNSKMKLLKETYKEYKELLKTVEVV